MLCVSVLIVGLGRQEHFFTMKLATTGWGLCFPGSQTWDTDLSISGLRRIRHKKAECIRIFHALATTRKGSPGRWESWCSSPPVSVHQSLSRSFGSHLWDSRLLWPLSWDRESLRTSQSSHGCGDSERGHRRGHRCWSCRLHTFLILVKWRHSYLMTNQTKDILLLSLVNSQY